MSEIKTPRTEQAVNDLAGKIVFSIKRTVPVLTGELQKSVDYRLERKNVNYVIVIKYLKYGDYVDGGTKYIKQGKGLTPWKYVINDEIKKNIDKVLKAYAIDVKDYIKNKMVL